MHFSHPFLVHIYAHCILSCTGSLLPYVSCRGLVFFVADVGQFPPGLDSVGHFPGQCSAVDVSFSVVDVEVGVVGFSFEGWIQ